MAADAPLAKAAAGVRPDAFAVDFGSDAVLLHLKGKKNPLYAGLTILYNNAFFYKKFIF